MIVYEGPSRIGDGSDIVAVVTGLSRPSKNPKTGDMAQLWILDAASHPVEAALSGADASVCGACAMRAILKPDVACYVTLIHGPAAVWKKWKAGGYSPMPGRYWFRKPLRFGAYGDPAAIPLHITRDLITRSKAGWTGYTHQWARYQSLRRYFMASVDTHQQAKVAQGRGWRTFRVSDKPDTWLHEMNCPASKEAGKRTTCRDCLLCNGARRDGDRRKNIQIGAH